MKQILFAFGAVFTLGLFAFNRPSMNVPLFEKVDISIDGKIDEDIWKRATHLTHLISPVNYSPEGAQTLVKVIADSAALYISARSDRIATSARPKGVAPRDRGLMSDIIEVHLKPSMKKNIQYQILFDAAGNIWDNRISYDITPGLLAFQRTKREVKWTASQMTSAAADEKTFWTFEARIPWETLEMKPPQDGEKMRANFCRADYGNGVSHNQLCEWGVCRGDIVFADYRNWGDLVFRKNTATVTRAEIEKGGRRVFVSVKSDMLPFKGEVVLMEPEGNSPIESFPVEVASKSEKDFSFDLKKQFTLGWIEVKGEKELIFRRFGRPRGTILMVELPDVKNYRKRHFKIPNDTDWYQPFKFVHTLTGKTGNKVYGNPPELKARFWAEVPEGVTIKGIKYSDWGGDLPFKKPLSCEKILRDGKKYFKYELPVFISGVNKPLVFLRSSHGAGSKGVAYFYFTWKDGAGDPVPFPFEVVSYGRVKPFERMQMRLDDITPNLAYAITADPAKELPSLGINVWKIHLNPDPAQERVLEPLVDAMKKSGNKWYFAIQNELNGILWWVNKQDWGWQKNFPPDETGLFRDIEGRPVRSQFSSFSPCLMYRGTNYQITVARTLQSKAVRKYGVTWIILDWEFWGDEPCFCNRCTKELFPQYCKDKGLEDFGDPREFMRDEKKNARASKAYREFFRDCKGKLYRDFKNDLNKGIDRNRITWNAPKEGGFVISDWVSPTPSAEPYVDFFDWPFAYRPPWLKPLQDEAQFNDVVKGRGEKIVASLNSMQGCEFNQEFPPIATYYNMMEAATMGVRGFEYWYAPVIDAETYWYIMRGLRMIRPFEDIVLDGSVTVRGTEKDCSWRRVSLRNEALYCVRNYSLKEKKLVTFTVDSSISGAVYDTQTSEKIKDLEIGANEVSIELSPENAARLLYAGPSYSERIARCK